MRKITAIVILSLLPSLTIPAQETKEISKSSNSSSTEEYTKFRFGYGAIVVSQSDNLIRFILQKKMADTHPLITIFGVVIGLPIFGFMGVIFGPLLLSLFFLFVDMFKKEYLDLRNNLPSR
jgi:hypothetical protein